MCYESKENRNIEAILKPQITFEGKAQVGEKAEHTQ
jgi:hypothetical protein